MSLDTKQPKGYRKAWNGGVEPTVEINGYCRRCEMLTELTDGERCVMCRSNDTRKLTAEEIARANS